MSMSVIMSAIMLTMAPVMVFAYETQYTREDSVKVMSLINKARQQKQGTNMIIFFARQLLGIPYVSHTLEVNKTEQLVINLRQLDCTTYVENVFALYLCMKDKKYTFDDFCDNILKIRYRGGGTPHYTIRLHYFTDWIEDNTSMKLCEEIQSPVPPFTSIQKIKVGFMSANPSKYKMLKDNPGYIPDIVKSEQKLNTKTYRYIPKASVTNSSLLRKTIHDGDILALTTNINGLDVHHVGFAVWHKDGLHLLNASSLRHYTVEEPQTLYTYLQKQQGMTGVRVVRLCK
ncbi:MAG: N-acetylmuramoyl-L-alanine amidase-like domain-containing protein [Prevotella sp.]